MRKGKQSIFIKRFGTITKDDITAPFKTYNRNEKDEYYTITLQGIEHRITEKEYVKCFDLYDSISITL